MKTAYIFGIVLVFMTLVFVLTSANFNQVEVSAKNLNTTSLSMKIVTPTPPAQEVSQVGSTDGIVIMGVVLVVIVTVPVLFRRKKKPAGQAPGHDKK
jgi:hypothetical protein